MIPSSLIVIGAGPGGYAAALDAAERGIPVTLIEREAMGGTCLNRGCIPSKYLLSRSTEKAIEPDGLKALIARKDAVLATLRQRMDQGIKSQLIKHVTGSAHFVSPHGVEVRRASGSPEHFEADSFILACGTLPVRPALFTRHPALHDSTSILALERRPEHLVVVGAGYIGSELACAFHGLGSKVTLIEKEATILATQPEFSAAASVLQRAFQKRGMTVWTATEVTSVQPMDEKTVSLTCSNGAIVQADAVLLALGRKPDFDSLNLPAAGLSVSGSRLAINGFQQTSVPHIYAIGDLVSPVPLAHTAVKEAQIAVSALVGDRLEPLDYDRIPRCVYTRPEAAAVGLTDVKAQAEGYTTRQDRYHFAASAKALVEDDTEGFWSVTSDSSSGKILGAMIVGPHATELIHLVALSLKAGFTATDIADTVFAHPTLSEGFQETMKRALRKPMGATHR